MTDFDRLVDLLRTGAVPAGELARLAQIWTPDRDPPFLDFVAGPVTASVGTADFGPPRTAEATVSFVPTPEPDGQSTPSATPTDDPHTPGSDTSDFQPRPTAPALPPVPPGGRYVPLRLHRSGGLGSVWVARDTVVERDVALKTIRPGRRVSAGEAARFVHEARLTGRLEHPCVVPVYDLPATRPADGPCYVMRFVAGRTLAEAAAAYHKDRAAAGPLALAGLLDAVVAVARAVGFAHGRGVLHRDLKGQNVVLGDHGEVFLLDWGLAVSSGEEAGESDSGWAALEPLLGPPLSPRRSAVGTPGFMAPEVVAGGEATPASDVYGLGATLYQVLTGRPPYTGPTVEHILRLVAAVDPVPVRDENPGVPKPLAAVCRKAMARDPAARYASADEFATDLRRFLADEPVAAYPEPWSARAARWARRHRTGVTAAVVLLIAAAVGSAAAAALVWREKENTAAEWERAERERDRAARNYAAAGGLAFELGQRITGIETGLDSPRATDQKRRAALDAARKAFDQLVADDPDNVTLRRQAANLHRFAANLRRLLGEADGADEVYKASVALWEGLDRRAPADPSDRDNLALTLGDYAAFQKRAGRLRAAAATLDRADDLAATLEGRLRPSAVRRTAGVLRSDRADVEYRLGRFAEAEAAAARAVELMAALAGVPAAEANPVDGVLETLALNQRAAALRELGRLPEARAEHDAAVAKADALGGSKGNPDARHFANRTRLGRAITSARVPAARDAAAKELDGVIANGEQLAEEFPLRVAYREVAAEAYLVRGELAAADGRPGPAASDLQRALEITRKLVDTPPQWPDHYGLRGRVYLAAARTAAAPADAARNYGNAALLFRAALRKDPENALHRRGLDEAERAGRPVPP